MYCTSITHYIMETMTVKLPCIRPYFSLCFVLLNNHQYNCNITKYFLRVHHCLNIVHLNIHFSYYIVNSTYKSLCFKAIPIVINYVCYLGLSLMEIIPLFCQLWSQYLVFELFNEHFPLHPIYPSHSNSHLIFCLYFLSHYDSTPILIIISIIIIIIIMNIIWVFYFLFKTWKHHSLQ